MTRKGLFYGSSGSPCLCLTYSRDVSYKPWRKHFDLAALTRVGCNVPTVDVCRNKYLLLNSQELNELSAISMKANIPEVEALVNTDRSLVCDGKKGLLTRILTVMKREPPDSSFR